MQDGGMSDCESWEVDTDDFPVGGSECLDNNLDADDDEPSQELTGSSELLRSRMSVNLLSAGTVEIGDAFLVEVHAVGQRLVVDI